MFGWFRRRKRRRMEVFSFECEGVRVCRDPVVIRRKLVEHGGENWPHLVDAVYKMARDAKSLPPDAQKMRQAGQEKAAAELAVLVSKAFDVPPLSPDGKGMTEADRLGVMTEFLFWCAAVVESTRPLVNSPPATASAGGDSA
jgi:hypothetical protein